jgi:hypothetical protein
MLGISMVEPFKEYYLIAGGTFILSTLYALYSTIFSHFHYFVLFIVFVAVILRYEAPSKDKNKNPSDSGGSDRFPRGHAAFSFVLTVTYLFVVIPIFTAPFGFKNFLLPDSAPGFYFKHFASITSELRTWILNDSIVNRQKLACFYGMLIFSTVISALMLYSMIRRWKRLNTGKAQPVVSHNNKDSGHKVIYAWFAGFLQAFPRYFFGLVIIAMMLVVVVQTVSIPVNYGILLKSNHYPEVKVEMLEPGVEFLDARDTAKECKLWLLRENREELLLYAVFYQINSEDPVYKLLTLKRNLVKKIEISDNSFIFKYK